MTAIPMIPIILVLIVVFGIAAIPAYKIRKEEFERTGKHPKGYYLGIGLAIGMALGMPIGIAMDVVSLGLALGLPLGLAIGTTLEKKHEKELRPLSEREIKMQRYALIGGVVIFFVGVAVYFFVLSTSNNIN